MLIAPGARAFATSRAGGGVAVSTRALLRLARPGDPLRQPRHVPATASVYPLPRPWSDIATTTTTRGIAFPRIIPATTTVRGGGGAVDGDNTHSVTGLIYDADPTTTHPLPRPPPVRFTLFTKAGCTLCDRVTDVLREIRYHDDDPAISSPLPSHSLYAIDITDADQSVYFDKYQYDIPVLHLNGQYWTKHRVTRDAVLFALRQVATGQPTPALDREPNAAAAQISARQRRTQPSINSSPTTPVRGEEQG